MVCVQIICKKGYVVSSVLRTTKLLEDTEMDKAVGLGLCENSAAVARVNLQTGR
jgi:hypothetical protein